MQYTVVSLNSGFQVCKRRSWLAGGKSHPLQKVARSNTPTMVRTPHLSYLNSPRFHSAAKPSSEMWKGANGLNLYLAFSDFGPKKWFCWFFDVCCVFQNAVSDVKCWLRHFLIDWGIRHYSTLVDQVNVSQQIIHQNGCCIAHSKNIAQEKIFMRRRLSRQNSGARWPFSIQLWCLLNQCKEFTGLKAPLRS